MRHRSLLLAALSLATLPCPALPCSLCYNIRQTPSLRQEANSPGTRLVLFGVVSNPRFTNASPGSGVSDFRVEAVLKVDPSLPAAQRKRIGDRVELPYYLPVTDPKNPPRQVIFCGVRSGRIDPYRGVPAGQPVVDYLRGALALDTRDIPRGLLYFFRHLDHPNVTVSHDAFMEFVKASDQQIGTVARHLPAAKLRAWLRDSRTPAERIGLYAFLLGACGGKEDVPWFQAALARTGDRSIDSVDGILSGYIQLCPKEGWDYLVALLGNGKHPLPLRLAVLRTLRFYHAWKPREMRAPVLKALGAMVEQGELADLAVEELRKGRLWDLTDAVLALYGRKGLDAPVHRRAILRYALSCPLPRSRAFVSELRKREADLVAEIEEVLQLEKQ
jgi:hypothetical protein